MDINLIKQKTEQMAIIYEEIVKSIPEGSIPDDHSREAIVAQGLMILGKTLTGLEMSLYASDEVINDVRKTVAHRKEDNNE